jgi:hypothetical protein
MCQRLTHCCAAPRRHVYALARWGYARGIRLYELYNEPDLDGCLQVGTAAAYLEHYMLRARAVRNCYEDLNAGKWVAAAGTALEAAAVLPLYWRLHMRRPQYHR